MTEQYSLSDSMKNQVAELNTGRDKASHAEYGLVTELMPQTIQSMYRGGWLSKKIVNIPADDATRNWRKWQAKASQITAIENEETRLGLQLKVHEALILARLTGGSCILIGDGSKQIEKPLRPDSIGKGGLRFLLVLNKDQVTPVEIDNDVTSERFGLPSMFAIANTQQRIHPSRLAFFVGDPVRDGMNQKRWYGDSVLQASYTAIRDADAALGNIASMLYEAKIDVFGIPDLMNKVADPEFRSRVVQRTMLAAMTKGVNGMMVRDTQETYEQKQLSFGSLAEILDRYLQVPAAAADIPATRLLSMSPGGMNATGESDLRNYYDRVKAAQTLVVQPAIAMLDACLIRSALGTRPRNVFFVWASLWQSTPEGRAAIGKTIAETAKTLADAKLFPSEVLATAVANTLTEHEVLPGLESGLAAYFKTDEADAMQTKLADAAPRPLYVSRKVLNAADIVKWARDQGIPDVIDSSELHVTIAYSRTPVDWLKMGVMWGGGDAEGHTTIGAGGPRVVERLGDFVVLSFANDQLRYRNEEMRENGASWDYADYTPHVSISTSAIFDPDSVQAYPGPIELGPEIFETLKD